MTTEIIKATLIAGAGSFLGGAARYLVSVAFKELSKGFPWGTLLVNLAGCLLIGLLSGLFNKTSGGDNYWPIFLTAGLCSGFTTFSTLSKEALSMLQCGNYLEFASYIAISIIGGIALVAAGYIITK